MPGSALVCIGSREWAVAVATTPEELTRGLAGLASLPQGMGMLFALGVEAIIPVTTQGMRFPIDILWITGSLVVAEMARGVPPGYLATPQQPAGYFLEVNAGETARVEVGAPIAVQPLSAPAAPLQGPALDLAGPIAQVMVLGLLFGVVASVGRAMLPVPEKPAGAGLMMAKTERCPEPDEGRGSLPKAETGKAKPTREDVSVGSWVERDRVGIWLTDNRTGKGVIAWWDEDAAQMFEDGFFRPGTIKGQTITGQDFEESVLAYAEYIGVLGKAGLPYLPQTIERSEAIEVPFRESPAWVQEEWQRLHPGSIPRVRVYRTTVARIHSPTFDYAVRDIVAHKAGKTMARYVPSYESLLAATPEERALYFGGAVKLAPDEAIAVMDFWGDRFKSIDLYVNPAAYEPPRLLAPTLTERQLRLLATIRSYIPSYRPEVFQANRVTQAELDELHRLGLVDRRGALTVMGRNAAGRTQPLDRYGEASLQAKPVPHLIGPGERREAPEELEFFADDAHHCCDSVDGTGLRPQLEEAFRVAIDRAKGGASRSSHG